MYTVNDFTGYLSELREPDLSLKHLVIIFFVGAMIQFVVYYIFCEVLYYCREIDNVFTAIAVLLYVILFLKTKQFEFVKLFSGKIKFKEAIIVGVVLLALILLDFILNHREYSFQKDFPSRVFLSDQVILRLSGTAFEELFYRGIMLAVLAEKLGIFLSVVLVSVIWTLVHYFDFTFLGLLYIFVMGLVLSLVFVATRNLIYPILIHLSISLLWLFSV